MPLLIASLVAVAAVVLYAGASVAGNVDSGSSIGIGFGIGAVGALVLVMAYSIRRALPAVRGLGRTRGYLQMHVWGGSLFLLLMLLHSNLRLPAGVLTVVLWWTAIWVVLTGVLGTLLQRWIPKVLAPTASFEVHLRRIPELVAELRRRAEEAAGADPRIRAFYERQLAQDLAAPRMVGVALFASGGATRSEGRATDVLRGTLPADATTALDELRRIHTAKREMDVHYTLQRLLRGWLYLHVPFAVILLGLVALHVFFTTYF